jgi:sugar lactone lactonase YvrE
MTGLAVGESPRWHDGRLWFCHWTTGDVVAVDLDGKSEVTAAAPSPIPYSIDWLPDGRLLIIAGQEGQLLRQEPDGELVSHADLSAVGSMFNEIVVDGRGNIYVNGGIFTDKTVIALITADGSVRTVAEDFAFPNGMAITPDNSTLIIAESHANCLTAFDIAPDGGLSNRRVWAQLGDGVPDGICIDAGGAVWYADVPNARCVRVAEGGKVLQTIDVGLGCFACMLGGEDGKTLFILAAEWHGMEAVGQGPRTGQVLMAQAPAAGVGWPAS